MCAVVYEGSWHKSGGLESYRIKKINNLKKFQNQEKLSLKSNIEVTAREMAVSGEQECR